MDDKKKLVRVREIEDHDKEPMMSPKNDFVFKRIFGDEKNKDILKSFLSAVMRIKPEKFEELDLINTELTRKFAEDRKGILDVRVRLKDGTEIDIEIQLSYTRFMAERTLYYWGKMYTENIQTGDSYSKLKKCVTINILDFKSLPISKPYSKLYITEDETKYKLTDVLEIYYLELPKLYDENISHKIDEDDPIIQWMMFLGANNKEVLRMLAERNPEIKKATSILEVMSKSKKERMLYEAREAQLHDIATRIEEGRDEGREEGRVEGREEGIEEEKAKITRKLLAEGLNIALVAKYTDLSPEEVEKIQKEVLKNQKNE